MTTLPYSPSFEAYPRAVAVAQCPGVVVLDDAEYITSLQDLIAAHPASWTEDTGDDRDD